MTKNKDILKPFEVIERQTLEVENVVEKNKYFTILFFSQLYTQLDTCQNVHPCVCAWPMHVWARMRVRLRVCACVHARVCAYRGVACRTHVRRWFQIDLTI